jgi:D-hexose-6-phosphate mutarotase
MTVSQSSGNNKMNHDQLPQWIQSQNSSEFCHFGDVPDDVRSQLRQEDKYTTTIHGFRYTVKNYEDKWLVFRRNISMNNVKTTQAQHYMIHVNNIREIKIMSLNEANEYIQCENPAYNVFGSDPVKIINNEVCVVMAKYAAQSAVRSRP